jgi:hypothetical protein
MMVIDLSLVQYFFVTAVAAFVGASAAFYWERCQKENDETNRNLSAGNRAIFILSQQYNVLYSLNKYFIDPFRKDPSGWLNMPAALPLEHNDFHFDVASLQFLLNSGNSNLLSKLLLEEQRFFEAIKTLNERSQLHRYELQPKLDTIIISKESFLITPEIEKELGQTIIGGLKTLTSALTEQTDEGMAGIKKIYNEIKSQLEKEFPNKKIIKLEFKETENILRSEDIS